MSTKPIRIARRSPKYGDEVYIPSEHPDGHWTNGICNALTADNKLLVAAPGHAKSNTILVPLYEYGTAWCWPEDVNKKAVGAKAVLLEDLEG